MTDGPESWHEPRHSQRHTRQGDTPERWGKPWRTVDDVEHPVTIRRVD